MKTNAIRVHKLGGPEEMVLEQVEVAAPKENEVIIKQKAIGLNFIDTYFRSGLYPAPLPTSIGMEASGVVEELGPGVTEFKIGDRVSCSGVGYASHSEVVFAGLYDDFPPNLIHLPGRVFLGVTTFILICPCWKFLASIFLSALFSDT